MTNLLNLSAVSKDEIIIGATSPDENDLSQVILEWVLNKEYLPAFLHIIPNSIKQGGRFFEQSQRNS